MTRLQISEAGEKGSLWIPCSSLSPFFPTDVDADDRLAQDTAAMQGLRLPETLFE